MKTFLMIACVVVIATSTVEVTGRSVRSTDPFEECQADPATHVDEELLKKFGRGELDDEIPLAVHVLCMNVKKRLQSPTGEINVEGLRAYLKLGDRHPIDFVNKVMYQCASKKGATAQEAAVGLLHCIYGIMPHEIGAHGIFSYYQPTRVARRSIAQHGIVSENLHSDVHLQQPMKKDLFHQFHNDCQADPASRVDEYLFLRIFQGEQVEEPTFGLHTLCINVKGGLQSQNGDINEENLRTYLLTSSRNLNSTVVDDIMKECGHRNGVTASEAAVALLRCLMNQQRRLKHHGDHRTPAHKEDDKQTVGVSGRHVRTHFQECQSDPNTHVDAALIRKGLRGELSDKTPLGPHALCVNIKRGFQNKNGDINVEALRAYLNQADNRDTSLVDRVVRECGQRNGTTAELAALNLLDCVHRIIPHVEHHQECPSRDEIDEDQYFEALKGAHENEAALAHYVICQNVHDGLQSRNGDVSVEGIRAYLTDGPRHNATAVDIIVKECGQRKGTTVQDAAWALIRCLHRHIIALEPERH